MGKHRNRQVVDEHNLPATSDPSWWRITEPLFDFIESGPGRRQPIQDIKEWARWERISQNLLVNSLAWLKIKNIVRVERIDDTVYWIAQRWTED